MWRTSCGPNGYPFTGLGDPSAWNPTTDEVGSSKFVLRAEEPLWTAFSRLNSTAAGTDRLVRALKTTCPAGRVRFV